jgi:hypothetical protein
VTGVFGIVTDGFGNVTGHFGDMTVTDPERRPALTLRMKALSR